MEKRQKPSSSSSRTSLGGEMGNGAMRRRRGVTKKHQDIKKAGRWRNTSWDTFRVNILTPGVVRSPGRKGSALLGTFWGNATAATCGDRGWELS